MQPTFWQSILDALLRQESVYLSLVTDHEGSSPGTKGAAMAVFQSGKSIGTIGGGIMEQNIQQHATARLAEPFSQQVRVEQSTLQHRENAQSPSGLICAGSQNMAGLIVTPIDRPVIEAISDQEQWHLSPMGLRAGKADAEVLYQPAQHGIQSIVICGGGHCGKALQHQLSLIGIQSVIYDEREDPLPTELPGASEQAAIVMTHSFQSDVDALRILLPQPFRFIGLMGSKAKIARIKKELEGAEGLEKVTAPVGLKH